LYSHKILDNGLDVILVKRDSMMSASVLFCVKTGSSKESEESAGLSHLIEHVSFRATKRKNTSEIKQPIEEVGGILNAFTSKNLTVFFAKIPSLKVNETLEILSEILYEPLFKEDDIEKEKGIILEEISSYEDEPINIVFENLYKNIYDENFSRPIMGYKDSIMNIKKATIEEFHNKYYQPENTVVIISGKFNEDSVLKQLNRIKSVTNLNSLKNKIASPSIVDKEIFIKKFKNDLASNYLVQGFKAPSKLDKAYYATLVLNTFLGSGMSSLLFSKIREEEGLAYEITSDYETYPEAGLLLFYAATTEKNLENLLEKIQEVVENLKNNKEIEKWFNYGKNRLIGKLTLEVENNLSMALNILDLYVNYGKIITIEEFIKNIEKVEIHNVIETAKNIFSNNKYVSILSPNNQ